MKTIVLVALLGAFVTASPLQAQWWHRPAKVQPTKPEQAPQPDTTIIGTVTTEGVVVDKGLSATGRVAPGDSSSDMSAFKDTVENKPVSEMSSKIAKEGTSKSKTGSRSTRTARVAVKTKLMGTSIDFASQSAVISDEARRKLLMVAEGLKSHEGASIRVQALAATSEPNAKALAAIRAQAIRAVFTGAGVHNHIEYVSNTASMGHGQREEMGRKSSIEVIAK